jgi:hypothetical protein
MNLNPGDPCRVRLHDGRVVGAKYDEPCGDKQHFVIVGEDIYLASSRTPTDGNAGGIGDCRFVASPCVLEPV